MLPVEPRTAIFFPGRVMGKLGKGRSSWTEASAVAKVALYEKRAEGATWFLFVSRGREVAA